MAKNSDVVYKQSEEYYRKGGVVISREYGKHENGNMFGGCWVARDIGTGEYIDNDRSRMSLFERLGFKDEEFSGSRDPITAGFILMLTTELPTPGKRFWIPVTNGWLVIENRKGAVYFEGSGDKEYVDYLEVVCMEFNGHHGERTVNPQKFHPADVAEAVECFIGRAMSLQPAKEYSSKAADTLPRILAREKILRATEPVKGSTIPVLSLINTEEYHESAHAVLGLDFSLMSHQAVGQDGWPVLIEKIKQKVEVVFQDKNDYKYSIEAVLGIFTPEFKDEILNDKNRLKKRFLLILGERRVRVAWGDDLPYTLD